MRVRARARAGQSVDKASCAQGAAQTTPQLPAANTFNMGVPNGQIRVFLYSSSIDAASTLGSVVACCAFWASVQRVRAHVHHAQRIQKESHIAVLVSVLFQLTYPHDAPAVMRLCGPPSQD